MTRHMGLLLLLFACGAFLVACSAPADEPATNLCDALERHATTIKAGKFDKAAFEKELKPLVEEVAKHKSKDDGKIPMTEKVLERWQKVHKDFVATAENDMIATLAYITVMKPITDDLKK